MAVAIVVEGDVVLAVMLAMVVVVDLVTVIIIEVSVPILLAGLDMIAMIMTGILMLIVTLGSIMDVGSKVVTSISVAR